MNHHFPGVGNTAAVLQCCDSDQAAQYRSALYHVLCTVQLPRGVSGARSGPLLTAPRHGAAHLMRPAPARTGGIYFRAFYLNYHSREASDTGSWGGDVVQGYRGPSLSGVLCEWGGFYAMFVLFAKIKARMRRSQRCRNVSLEKQMVVAVVGRGDTGRPANHRPAHRTPANRRPAHGCLWHIHQLCWHSPHCQQPSREGSELAKTNFSNLPFLF